MLKPLSVLLVEDEVLLLVQIEAVLARAGHIVVGHAVSSPEAIELAASLDADLALVDVHLADGPTGIEVARFIVEKTRTAVVFMTANPRQVPESFVGAIGTIAKPYTQHGLRSAFDYIAAALRDPPPPAMPPRGLVLAPRGTALPQLQP